MFVKQVGGDGRSPFEAKNRESGVTTSSVSPVTRKNSSGSLQKNLEVS
jgi:hypothetical protein